MYSLYYITKYNIFLLLLFIITLIICRLYNLFVILFIILCDSIFNIIVWRVIYIVLPLITYSNIGLSINTTCKHKIIS